MSDGTGSEKSDRYKDFKEIANRLGEPRRDLLQTFLRSDVSVLNTAELREHSSTPRGSTIHHLERLDDWGLVEEQPDREYHGRGGQEARTWKLTDRGRAFCEEYVDAPVDPFVSPEDVAEISQRVDEIEDNLKDLKGVMMQLGVHTDMMSIEQAREEMGEEWFQEVFRER